MSLYSGLYIYRERDRSIMPLRAQVLRFLAQNKLFGRDLDRAKGLKCAARLYKGHDGSFF